MREDEVHFAVRRFLQREGWLLIAGQYPNGSDDELPILNVKDPSVARDDSPDPRRHAQDKLVPDLISLKDGTALVIEMKPDYDLNDELKLLNLLTDRRTDFLCALDELSARTPALCATVWRDYSFVPALGFSLRKSRVFTRPGFAMLHVESLSAVTLHLPY